MWALYVPVASGCQFQMVLGLESRLVPSLPSQDFLLSPRSCTHSRLQSSPKLDGKCWKARFWLPATLLALASQVFFLGHFQGESQLSTKQQICKYECWSYILQRQTEDHHALEEKRKAAYCTLNWSMSLANTCVKQPSCWSFRYIQTVIDANIGQYGVSLELKGFHIIQPNIIGSKWLVAGAETQIWEISQPEAISGF